MRQQRKKSEQQAIEILKNELLKAGKNVFECPDFVDKPDALLVVDGERIAVECRIISPQKIMEFHSIKKTVDDLYMFFLPVEPHLWIKQAIDEKAEKKQEYKDRSNAQEVWLVAHVAGLGPGVGKEPSWVWAGYTYGVYISDNPFERVYIIDEMRKEILCVYNQKRGYCIKEIGEIKYPPVNKIPIHIEFFSNVVIEKLDSGEPGVRIKGSLHSPDEILCLQPIDDSYSADYSGVEGQHFSSIWSGNKFPEIFAYKKT